MWGIMEIFKTYKHGLTTLCRAIILFVAISIFLILFIAMMPLWWIKHIQKLFSNLGDKIEKIMYW